MPCIKLFRYAAACGALALFFFCSKDYNPFTDPSNARAVVKYKSFRDIDTIGIFRAETLQVEVAAQGPRRFVFNRDVE